MKTILKSNNSWTVYLLIVSLILSCKGKDEPKPETPPNTNEVELITTMKLVLKESISGDESVFVFSDIDGPGGIAPTQDNILLDANKTYTGEIILLDKTKSPIDTVSKEIEAKKDEHQFFYVPNNVTITTSYTDFDSHGVPVGLLFTLTTGNTSSGTLKVILKHQPGVKPVTGNGNSSLGETDIEVVFSAEVQ